MRGPKWIDRYPSEQNQNQESDSNLKRGDKNFLKSTHVTFFEFLIQKLHSTAHDNGSRDGRMDSFIPSASESYNSRGNEGSESRHKSSRTCVLETGFLVNLFPFPIYINSNLFKSCSNI